MAFTPDQERWAEALHVLKTHGPSAGRHVAERITALRAQDDAAGVERWLAIGARVEQLGKDGTVH